MKKQIISLLLSSVMAVSLFAGCSNKEAETSKESESKAEENKVETSSAEESSEAEENEIPNFNAEGFPIVDEEITLTLMGAKHAVHGEWSEMSFFTTMEELTGIHFEFTTPLMEVYEEQKSLAFVSDEYADVWLVANFSKTQVEEYGVQDGYLIPLNDLIEQYAPNIQKMLEEPGVKQALTSSDGNIYALPYYGLRATSVTAPQWISGAWLEAIGYTEEDLPTDVDEFYTMLKLMQDAGCKYPLTGYNKDLYRYSTAFGLPSLNFYEDDNGKVQFGMKQKEQAEAYFNYMNKLYEEGLLDPSALTNTDAEVVAKAEAGEVGVSNHASPGNLWSTLTKEELAACPVVPALSSDVSNGERMCVQVSGGVQYGAFALSDRCENPEAMIRWVDYLYSVEGSRLMHWGPEGEIYELTGEEVNGFPVITEFDSPIEGINREEYRGGHITPNCGGITPEWRRDEMGVTKDIANNARDRYLIEYLQPYMRLAMPDLVYTEEEVETINIYSTDLYTYVDQYKALFVVGESDISYDEFLEGLEEFHLDELLAAYQSALDRYNGVSQ